MGSPIAIELYQQQAVFSRRHRRDTQCAIWQFLGSRAGTPRTTVKLGTSDMNVVGPVWQCPILAYGPGDSSLDHTPEEHIVLDDYLRAIRVLTEVLVAL